MGAYTVELSNAAFRELRKLDPQTADRIRRALATLAEHPRPPQAKPLKGWNDALRVRVGDYRIIYRIYEDKLTVLVLQVGHRREVYRK